MAFFCPKNGVHLNLKDKPDELKAALEKLGREIEEERQRLREPPSEPPSVQSQDEEIE